jgi:HlyD family secretion protein
VSGGTRTSRLRPRPAHGVVVALALTGVGTAIWLTWGSRHSAAVSAAVATGTPSVPTVSVVRPTPGGIERAVQQPASIRAFETVDLYAMVSGYLKTQAVDIGSRVTKGEVLAEINVPRDAKAVEEAVALVEQARAKLAQTEALIRVAAAQRDAAAAMANQAASDVGRLRAERVLAEKQFARISELEALQGVERRLLDEQQARLDSARAAERTAEIAVQTARARALAAAAELEKAKVDAVAARAAVGVAEASRDRLRVNLDYARITAPFAGVVTHRTFHPGALIHSGLAGEKQPLLTVKRTDLMRVVVLVPDRDVVLTRVGDQAVVSVDALADRSFQGTLARIAQAEDADRMMRVEIDLPNPDSALYDGMYGKATIALRHDANCLAVPVACVFERIGRSQGVVYVARDGVARRTEVTLGADNGTWIEVRSGIGPDDRVIRRSGAPIEDGMRIATAG